MFLVPKSAQPYKAAIYAYYCGNKVKATKISLVVPEELHPVHSATPAAGCTYCDKKMLVIGALYQCKSFFFAWLTSLFIDIPLFLLLGGPYRSYSFCWSSTVLPSRFST
jgi:hypothetical protein